MKTRTWTRERARDWMREYKARTRQDPAIRARDNKINRESAARRRGWRQHEHWAIFPFGYQAPPGLEGRPLFIHFMEFLHSISRDDGVANYYWRAPFDPRCEDAKDRWNALLSKLTHDRPGVDPLEKINKRANTLINNNERVPTSIT